MTSAAGITRDGNTWRVKSRSQRDLARYVEYHPRTGAWSCTCPDHRFRRRRCWHILHVQEWQLAALMDYATD